jgi:hypothetical protein
MMSSTELERQALGAIAEGLAGSDPRLASMLNIFSRLAAGEEMPVREKIQVRRGRPAAHRPRRARLHPRQGTALPQARSLYPRLGLSRAMLLLWAVTSAALLTVALVLNSSGPKACIQSMGTACPSPSIPQHADASRLMNLRLRAEAFPHRQPAGCAIGQLDPQAHMIGTTCPPANGGPARRPAGYLP